MCGEDSSKFNVSKYSVKQKKLVQKTETAKLTFMSFHVKLMLLSAQLMCSVKASNSLGLSLSQ